MSYVSSGYFGTGAQVQAINQALKASAEASPEQLYPPLAPVKFKETPMYVSSGSSPSFTNPLLKGKTFAMQKAPAYDNDTMNLPVVGPVKKTYVYIGAGVAALLLLKKLGKI